MGLWWLISSFLINTLLWIVKAEFYTSIDQMTQLIFTESDLIESFRNYIAAEEMYIERLKRCLDIVESSYDEIPEDVEKYISNPLTAYKFVRRLKHKWSVVESVASQSPAEEFNKVFSENAQYIPSDEDVDGIALGLVRLQETYRVHPQTVLRGGFGDMTLGTLSPDEAWHVGTVAQQNHKFLYAFLWMQEALRQVEEGREAMITQKEILTTLAPFTFNIGDLPRAIELTERLLTLDPSDMMAAHHLQFYKHIKESIQQDKGQTSTADMNIFIPSLAKDIKAYEALCRGEDVQMTPGRQRALFCRYSTGGRNPRLIYAPIKEEDEWDQPQITRYHNLVSDSEIETIKKLSIPKLTRAQVSDPVTGRNFSAELRIAKSAWLAENEDPVVSRVNQRIADVTGLDTKMAEMLQVANYGIGGQYEPHYDSKLANDAEFHKLGGRIATTLIYMTDVNVGGATVFPSIGAALQPIKGSAVFWYNLLQNGEEDGRTLHAACPVMAGNKWVSNKWIRARGQEFRRRCALSASE
ncbi:hypothetical protein AGOR_G00021480 [Albula goreensis]|uniref:procollagen-proline 4-dioxygenase n=1 Tax=Albula goreensis TaxID=1534307 RepID=A0A8T3E0R0_9TELE|nr:hypothetical protein AGOR_G00021480 [Albula goreensis]